MPQPSFHASLRIGADLCHVHRNSRGFPQAELKKYQMELHKWKLKWMQEEMREGRIFAMHCENFARIAKNSQP